MLDADVPLKNSNGNATDAESLRQSLKDLDHCLSRFEKAELNLESRMQMIEQNISVQQNEFNLQFHNIRECIKDIDKILSETGIARWRSTAESTLALGKDHIRTLEAITQRQIEKVRINNEEFQEIIKKSVDRLDKVSTYTINSVSEAISSFRIGDFQRITEQSCHTIEETASLTMQTLKETIRWHHWKNIILAATIAVFSTFTVTLFLNDEMPWERHKHVSVERQYGEALMHAWPHLNEEEQQKIIQHSQNVLKS